MKAYKIYRHSDGKFWEKNITESSWDSQGRIMEDLDVVKEISILLSAKEELEVVEYDLIETGTLQVVKP